MKKIRGFLANERRPELQPWCCCKRARRRPGQRRCHRCHAEDMKARRAVAIARGTYHIRGTGGTSDG